MEIHGFHNVSVFSCSLFTFMTTALKFLELQRFMLFLIIMFSSMVWDDPNSILSFSGKKEHLIICKNSHMIIVTNLLLLSVQE